MRTINHVLVHYFEDFSAGEKISHFCELRFPHTFRKPQDLKIRCKKCRAKCDE